MKKPIMIGIACACLITGALAFAAEPGNGDQGGAGMQQEQQPGDQQNSD